MGFTYLFQRRNAYQRRLCPRSFNGAWHMECFRLILVMLLQRATCCFCEAERFHLRSCALLYHCVPDLMGSGTSVVVGILLARRQFRLCLASDRFEQSLSLY